MLFYYKKKKKKEWIRWVLGDGSRGMTHQTGRIETRGSGWLDEQEVVNQIKFNRAISNFEMGVHPNQILIYLILTILYYIYIYHE